MGIGAAGPLPDISAELEKRRLLACSHPLLPLSQVFLDPPSNLTVQFMESSGQLNVSWQSPPIAYMENSIRYEVSVSPEGYRPQRVSL